MGKIFPKCLRAELENQGFAIRETKKGFFAIAPDSSKGMVLIHNTESDRRAEKNTLARLRRAGFVWSA